MLKNYQNFRIFSIFRLQLWRLYHIINAVSVLPTICVFNRITLMMYLREKEHNPPHVHAFYGGEATSFLLSSGELYDGAFPSKQRTQVKEFVLKHKDEL